MENIIEKYFDYLKNEKKVSQNTLASYRIDVCKFADYIEKSQASLEKATKTHILTYLMEIEQNGISQSTVARNLASLRSLYGFLMNKRIISENPTENIKGYKAERKLPEILTGMEVEILLDQAGR